MMDPSASKPLRILSVLNLDWNPHLGAARVYLELGEHWKAAGHTVEHFSFSEAFPRRHQSSREYALRRLMFPRRARAFIKANHGRFDVIDALAGSLAASKRDLKFDGLLVARSVGSHWLYNEFDRDVAKRWPDQRPGTWAGRMFYGAVDRYLTSVCVAAVRHADLVNLPNTDEANDLRKRIGNLGPIIVQPYGLTSGQRGELAVGNAQQRLGHKTICFVGMWGPRKGSRIWGEIMRRVRARIQDAKFCFLGTMVSHDQVLRDVGDEFAADIQSIPEFAPAELPKLLGRCAVGGFPSYVEGFGLALVEQLAAGVPTVAFDQGGPRDILGTAPDLLVPTGDVEAFAAALIRVLQLPGNEYERLQQRGVEIAARYSWRSIADDTINDYRSLACKVGH
ncbi:MAG TPA: glycosyltransferase [Chthoniobacterales bacterium]|nr:glycosyltransferase [Chthoniobacterales bacterium]